MYVSEKKNNQKIVSLLKKSETKAIVNDIS